MYALNCIKIATAIDFACGTGGFITSWLKALSDQKTTTEALEAYDTSVYGIEKKQFPYMLCVTNLLLHDMDTPRVYHDNSLLGKLYLEIASCNKIFDVLYTNKIPDFNQMGKLYEPDGSCPQRIFNLICKEGAIWFKAISKALLQYLNISNPIMLHSLIAAMLNFITNNGTLSDTSYSVIYTFMQMKYI